MPSLSNSVEIDYVLKYEKHQWGVVSNILDADKPKSILFWSSKALVPERGLKQKIRVGERFCESIGNDEVGKAYSLL